MKKTINLAMAAAFGLLLFGTAPVANAQDQTGDKIISSVEYEQADVREALRALFKNINVSYAIDPDVQGTVSVSLKNVPFDTALEHITRQVDATYQVQGGVYRIMRRPVDTGVNVDTGTGDIGTVKGNTKVIRRIKIRSADPMYIAAMIGAQGGNQDFNSPPERSTIINTNAAGGGGGGMGGGMGGGGMGGGMGGMGGGGFGGGGMGGGGFGGGSGGMGGGMGGRGGGGFGGGGGGFGGGGRGGFGG